MGMYIDINIEEVSNKKIAVLYITESSDCHLYNIYI